MSSGSESDEEYVPGEPEQVSEEESADEDTEKQYEDEQSTKKRKTKEHLNGRKKIKVVSEEASTKDESDNIEIIKPEEEKKREEDLWAKFLEGTDTKPKSKAQESICNIIKVDEDKKQDEKLAKKEINNDKEREKRIFEFAGETIVVENNVIKDRIKTADAPPSASKAVPSKGRSSGGLSNLVGQLNKKNKLSTLEKSKLDWNTYKQEEGIEEEVTSHNKGKDGYLDRQDFLDRSEMRQYEIERDLRMSRRSKR